MPVLYEELITLVIYVGVIYLITVSLVNLTSAYNNYAKSVQIMKTSQETEMLINSEISNFFIRYSKGIVTYPPIIIGEEKIRVYNTSVQVLPIDDDYEPY